MGCCSVPDKKFIQCIGVGDLKIMEIIIEILSEIADFILDLWVNKVKKRKK